MTIDRPALLEWLLPHCEPDTASVLYRKGKDVTSPLHGRLEMLRQAMQDAERCRQQLVETCPDEELRERLADLQRRHAEAHDRSFKLRLELCPGAAVIDSNGDSGVNSSTITSPR
jgi:hypothetical protein